MRQIPEAYIIAPEVAQAVDNKLPVVALETAVVTHGLPHPQNLELAGQMEATVRQLGAVPVTIGVLDGCIHVGLNAEQLSQLVSRRPLRKISTRDLGPAVAIGESGGTTVAGTLYVANAAGIRVFATGGIGGVHRRVAGDWHACMDISADLPALSRYPVIVVCAGAKAILDLPATIEYLETAGVPVVGYQTDDFPAFYSHSSGLRVSSRVDTPGEAALIARSHWSLGLSSAVLVVVPPPKEIALSREMVEEAIQKAMQEIVAENISGQAVTPYLLERVNVLTGGASLQTNLGLLLNNAGIASQIARAFAAV